jgi:hypothetical protein
MSPPATLERLGGRLWRLTDHRRQYRNRSNTARSQIYGTQSVPTIASRRSPSPASLAGGGTNFTVANNGNGRSDLFQAGAFIRHNVGAAYLSGALAYGWQDVTTDRTVTVAGIDQLRAKFNVNAGPAASKAAIASSHRFWAGSALRRTRRASSRRSNPGLCGRCRIRRQHLCARLWRHERDRRPQRTRPPHR